MAEEISIIRFELDSKQAEQNAKDLTGAIIGLSQRVNDANKSIKSLEKQNIELAKQVKAGKITQDEANKSTAENNAKIKELKISQAGLKDGIADLNKKRREEVAISKIQVGSLDALRKQTTLLNKERNSINRTTAEGNKRFQELTKQINKNNIEIRKADQAAGDFKSSVGNYQEAMSGALAQTGLFSGSLGRAITFLKGIKASLIATSVELGVLKTALISTGIGAVLVALGSLITFLTRTQRGIDAVSKVMAYLGAAADEILDRFAALGETMSEAIQNPAKLWEDFLGFLEKQVTNRIEGLVGIFAGLGKIIANVFTLSFDEIDDSLAETGDAFVKFTTGFETKEIVDGFNSVKKVIIDIGETALAEGDKAVALEQRFQALQDAQINFISERARIEKEIAELRLRAEDASLTDEQRISALRDAIELTRSLADVETKLTQEELAISEERLALGESTREDFRETEELRAKVFELQKARLLQEKKLTSELNTEEQKLFNARLKRLIDYQAINEELIEQNEENFKDFLEQQLDFAEQEIDAEDEKNKQLADLRAKNRENAISEAKNLGNELLSVISSDLKSQENEINKSYNKRQNKLKSDLQAGIITQEEFDKRSEELEKQKQLQLFEIELSKFKSDRIAALSGIGIDTASAVSKAIAESPLTFGLPWSAFAVAEGALQTAAVLKQPEPTRPSFAEGGDVKAYLVGGKRHSAGGTKFYGEDGTSFEAELDEGIFVTKRNATSEALSYINEKYGGRSFDQAGRYLQEGGSVVSGVSNISGVEQIVSKTIDSVLKNIKFTVSVEDIQNGLIEYNAVINQGVVQ